MRKLVIALACLCSTLALAGTAAAALRVGANDDLGKYESGNPWFFPNMAAMGLTVDAVTLRWDETAPTVIADQAYIQHGIDLATASGVTMELNIYPLHSQVFTNGAKCRPSANPESCGNAARIKQFATWAASVVRTFPLVREYVVMNECNQPLFVNPQWDSSGQNQSAAICGRALAAAYDAMKAVDKGIRIWGVGLSPRGNDKPTARSNSSTKPVTFVGALGKWWRAFVKKTGRKAPLMDGFDFHPYPVPQSQPFAQGYADVKSASVSNLPRIYQAFYDAFRGTPQRTIGQQKGGGLPVSLNETGVQTASLGKSGYAGTEVSATSAGGVLGSSATEEFQANWYLQMLNLVACDRNVNVVNIFHLLDEPNLAGWQSGLFFADQTPKRSAQVVRDWIAKTRGNCQTKLKSWTPAKPKPKQPKTK